MNFSIPAYPSLQFGTLYCIGRNYAGHAVEMKSEVPAEPVVFIKPRSSLIFNGQAVSIPANTHEVHHEVELVIFIGQTAKKLSADEAMSAVHAFGVGLDMTARDLQSTAKQKGLPWTLSKGMDSFAPLGNLVEFSSGMDLQNMDLTVKVNGETRQAGNTADMIFPVNRLISYLSAYFTLTPGDLIFTGTPEGVSAITPGDHIEASLGNGQSTLQVYVSD